MTPVRLPRSLQSRLLVTVLGLAALVWMAAAALTWADAKHELDELLDGHLAQAAALLVVQADGDDDDIGDAPTLHKYAPQVAFQVFIQGQLITRSSNAGKLPMSSVANGFSTVRSPDDRQWRVFATTVSKRHVVVYVGERIESRQAILWAVMGSMLWPLFFALPLLWLAGWWSVRTGLSPLRDLSRVLGQRPPQATEPVPMRGMPRELRPLVQAINELLDRIGRMVHSERRFTADAAHELRTPIAAIRAQAQVALGAGDDVQGRTHALQSTLLGCDRATRLVEQLLTLARLETNNAATAHSSDLGAVCQRTIADLVAAALDRGQTLELDVPSVCVVPADEVLLGVLVRNLVDNALRYSPDGARVVVTVAKTQTGTTLRVQDSGQGMAEQDIARLGERFHRVLGTNQPGSGLGWSIVKRLVDVFGAQVEVRSSQTLGGLEVAVHWRS